MIRVYKTYSAIAAGDVKSFVFINPYRLANVNVSMRFYNRSSVQTPVGEILFRIYHRQTSYGLQNMFTYDGTIPVSRLEIISQIDLDDATVEFTDKYGYFNSYIAGAGLHVFNLVRESGKTWSGLDFEGIIVLSVSAITNL